MSTRGLARFSAKHPWRIVAAWVVIILLAVVFALPNLGGVMTSDMKLENNPESTQGTNVIESAGLKDMAPISETVVIQSKDGMTIDDPSFQAVTQQVTDDLRALLLEWDENPNAQLPVANYYELTASGAPEAAYLVSQDRTTTIINVPFSDEMVDHVEIQEFMDRIETFDKGNFTVVTAGPLSVNETFTKASEEDIVTGEAIGIPIALIILGIVFGAIIAPLLPLAIGVTAIAVALAIVVIVGQFVEQQTFITNIITVLGLAVGIDYALFIVDRYREFRANGADRHQAIENAGATASKAVVFSAGTVIFALAGLWLVPNNIFRSLGLGAVVVVAATVVVSLTLLPAMLSLIGDRINWPRRKPIVALDTAHASEKDAYSGFWGQITHVVMARPIVSVILAGGLLVAAAIPVFQLHTGFNSGADGLPPSESKTAVEILEADFSAGMISPVRVVVNGPRDVSEPALNALIEKVNQSSDFVPVNEPIIWSNDSTTAILSLTLTVPSSNQEAFDIVDRLRNDLIPQTIGQQPQLDTWVTGESAMSRDMLSSLSKFTPWVFLFVLSLSFVLLMLAFRSIVVPATAIVLNLLSVGASYGLMVLVFQHGFLIDLFGFQKSPVIESWIPLMLFSILFGLSMDYHVFLLSRIREHFDLTGRNRESVAIGLRTTARIITGAALIMVAVFSGMAAGQVVSFQQMGFGLAVAVLIDATLIRSVLVPATMTLIGKWNWYLPTWLNWLPDLRIEGGVGHTPDPGTSGDVPAAFNPASAD
jgi:RND superfamily putative drug exporter